MDPFKNTYERERDACEAFRKLPKFQINSSFQKSSFENWTGDYRIFFRANYRSEMIDKCSIRLFVNADLIISNALLCSWGRSIVYITRNENIKFGLVLFIRNENAGLKILGVTAQFLPINVIKNDENVSAIFDERVKSVENRMTMHWSN